jgi:hypothetical protein
MAALPSARFDPVAEVASLRLDVDLPPVRLPFFAPSLRFSPFLTWWIADRRTHLQALRLGPAVLVGFPGDYSGHLADRLVESTRPSGLAAVATSFDGDFRGYLVSEPVFRNRPCYETRWMSFYGPWTGEYFNDLARRMVDRLSSKPPTLIRPTFASTDLAPRIALAILLVAAAVVGWRSRREWMALARQAGFVTVGLASVVVLAFEIAPDLFAWAKFGLPGWLRLLGFPLGVVALAARKRPGKAALLFAASCALLSAGWVVALMTLRGWARSSFPSRARSDRPGSAAGSASVMEKGAVRSSGPCMDSDKH